jgi:hypothetical protein
LVDLKESFWEEIEGDKYEILLQNLIKSDLEKKEI